MQPAQPAKIESLESLRGLAALGVVLYHLPIWHDAFNVGFIRNGYLLVNLFFVLSGFVIYTAYANKLHTPRDVLRFQFLRFGRLYPVHLLFLATAILVELAKYVAQEQFGIASPNTQPFAGNSLTAFVQQLFLLQAIGPTGHATTFNGAAWSISVEFYTYPLFGLIVLLLPRWKAPCLAVLGMLAFAFMYFGLAPGFGTWLSCIAGFSLGCVVAAARGSAKHAPLPRVSSTLCFLISLLFLALKPRQEFDYAMLLLSAALIYTLTMGASGMLHRLLHARPLVWLGSISYSLYMSHELVTWAANQAVRLGLRAPEAMVEGYSTPQLSLAQTCVGYGLTLTLALALGSLVYRTVEKPLRERSRRVAFSKF